MDGISIYESNNDLVAVDSTSEYEEFVTIYEALIFASNLSAETGKRIIIEADIAPYIGVYIARE